MRDRNIKKKYLKRPLVMGFFVLFFLGVFLVTQNAQAALFGNYNKAYSDTLDASEWNNLIKDFISTEGGRINTFLGINAATSTTHILSVGGSASFSNPIVVGTPVDSNHAATMGYVDSVLAGGTYWSPNGTHIFNNNAGNVGIGTTNPAQKLHVYGGDLQVSGVADTARVRLSTSGGAVARDWMFFSSSSDGSFGVYDVSANARRVTINTNGSIGLGTDSTQFNINSSGNVGIGTTNPVFKTTIYSSSSTDSFPLVVGQANSANEFVGIGLSGFIASNGAVKAGMVLDRKSTYGVGDILFLNNSTLDNSNATTADAKMTIQSGGNIGIGTTNPGTKLDITGTLRNSLSTTHSLLGGTGNVFVMADNSGTLYATTSASIINPIVTSASGWTANGTTVYKTDTNGNVGIGTTNPVGKLNVVVSGATDNLIYADTYSSAAGRSNYWFSRKSHSDTNGILLQTANGDALGTFYFQGVNSSNAFAYGAKILAQQNGVAGTYIPTDLNFSTYSATAQNSNQLVLSANGNVGIGTTNPSVKLEITGSTTAGIVAAMNNTNASGYSGMTFKENGADKFYFASIGSTGAYAGGANAVQMWNVGNGPILFATNNSEKLRILANGNVGIGLTNPSTTLDISGTLRNSLSTTHSLLGGTGNVFVMADNSGTLYATTSASIINPIVTSASGWTANGTTVYKTDTNGNVGIGTTTPSYPLHVYSSANNVVAMIQGTGHTLGLKAATPYAEYFNNSGTRLGWFGYGLNASDFYFANEVANQPMYFSTNGYSNIRMTIDGGGNIGIGTTNPGTKLDITGTLRNSLSTTHSLLGGSGNAVVMTDNTGSLYTTPTSTFISANNLDLWKGTKNGNIWNGDSGAGNVGIGTTNPASSLQIGGNGGISGSFDIQANTGSSWFSVNSGTVSFNAAGGSTRAGGIDLGARFNIAPVNDSMPTLAVRGYTGGVSDIMRVSSPASTAGDYFIIKANGNIGIGTTSPLNKVEIQGNTTGVGGTGSVLKVVQNGGWSGNNPYALEVQGYTYLDGFRVEHPGGLRSLYAVGGEAIGFATAGNSPITFTQSDTLERMRIAAGGNVGIGLTNPSTTLDISGTLRNSLSTTHSLLGGSGNAVVMTDNTGSLYTTPTSTFISANNLDLWKGTKNGNIWNGDSGAGNVGIGTTNPQIKLDVSGTARVSSGLDVGAGSLLLNSGRSVSIDYTGVRGRIQAANWGSSYEALTLQEGGGNVGVGVTNPSKKLDVSGDIRSNTDLFLDGSDRQRFMYLNYNSGSWPNYSSYISQTGAAGVAGTKGLVINANVGSASNDYGISFAVSSSSKMFIQHTGNVGIGLTNPSTTLDISGTLRNSLSTTHSLLGGSGNAVVMADNTGSLYTTPTSTFISANNLDLWKGTKNGNIWNGDSGAGNVGIGTTNPGHKLEVAGGNIGLGLNNKIQLESSGSSYNLGVESSPSGAQFLTSKALVLGVYNGINQGLMVRNSAGTSLFEIQGNDGRVYVNGNVGIGITNPWSKLTVRGAASDPSLVSGTAALFSVSTPGGTDLVITGTTTSPYTTSIQNRNVPGGSNSAYPIALNPLGGNVGIGTTNPGTKLDITGTLRNSLSTTHSLLGGSGNAVVMADNTGSLYTTPTSTFISANNLDLWKGTKNGNIWNGDSGAGNVGIGTTNPAAKFEISKAATAFNTLLQLSDTSTVADSESAIDWRNTEYNWNQARISIKRQGSANSFDMLFSTSKNGTMSEKLRIDEDGNVGIGTTNPLYSLDMTGTLRVQGNTIRSGGGTINFFDGTSGSWASIGVKGINIGDWDTNPNYGDILVGTYDFDVLKDDSTSIFTVKNAGNIGIGTTNPGTKLDITGTLRNSLSTTHSLLGGSGNAVVMTDNTGALYTTPTSTFISANNLDLWKGTKNGNIWNGDSGAGNVGIGTTNPGKKLEIAGNVVGGAFEGLSVNNETAYGSGVGSATARINFNRMTGDNARMGYVEGGNTMENSSTDGFLAFGTRQSNSLLERMRITNAGNVGIGATNPTNKLQIGSNPSSWSNNDLVVSGTNSGIAFYNTAGYSYIYGSHRLDLYGNGVNTLSLSSGNVGIGTSNPQDKLDLSGSLRLPAYTLGTYSIKASSTPLLSYAADGFVRFNNLDNEEIFRYGVGGGQQPLIIGSSNLGIGLTNPSTTLDISGTLRNSLSTTHSLLGGSGNAVVMADNTGSLYTTPTSTFISANNLDLWKGTKNGNIWNGDSGAGNVGIGTTNPGAKLSVVSASTEVATFQGVNNLNYGIFKILGGTAASPYWRGTFIGTNIKMTSTYPEIENAGYRAAAIGFGSDIGEGHIGLFTTSATTTGSVLSEQVRISNNGNVGIGTTNPIQKLSVGNLTSGPTTGIGVDGGASAGTASAVFSSRSYSGQSIWQLINKDNDFGISYGAISDANRVMTFLNNGNVGIGTTAPYRNLHVDKAGAILRVGPYYTAGGDRDYIDIIAHGSDTRITSANERFHLENVGGSLILQSLGGSVGIGTTSPASAKLHVSGSGTYDGVFRLTNTGTSGADTFFVSSASGWDFGANKLGIGFGTPASTNIKFVMDGTNGNVGIGSTAPGAKLDVNGSLRASSATISLLGNSGNVIVMADNAGNLFATSSATITGNYLPSTGGALSGDLNMGGHDILNINKLSVNTIDPLYRIKGINYSTFASSIAGGVKEEYIGKANISKNLSYTIDFDDLEEGSDLWVWRKTVDFSEDNVEVLITPYGGFAQVYSVIEDNKITFKSDRPVKVHYRLAGKRLDWRKWPTKAANQKEKPGFIIE